LPIYFTTVSNNSIKIATKCPRKFWYNYIEGIETPSTRLQIDGKNLHTSFQHFFKIIDPEVVLRPNLTFYQFSDYFYDRLIHNIPENLAVVPKYQYILANFAEMEAQLLINCKAEFNNDRDAIFKYWFPIHTELNGKAEKVKLQGIVDRIDCLFGTYLGEYVVLDYKSGNAPKWVYKEKKDLWVRELYSDQRRQGAIYKLIIDALKLLDKPVKYMCFVFPKDKVAVFEKVESQTIKALEKKRDEALEIANRERHIENFPCKIGSHCFRWGNMAGCEFHDPWCRATWTEDMLIQARESVSV
jgi:hypothetical protein